MANVQYFEVVQSHGNLTPEYLIEVNGDVPAWVKHCSRPFTLAKGEKLPDRPIFKVDVAAEARELAEAEARFASPKTIILDNADLRRILNCSDEQITVAIGHLNMPPGGREFEGGLEGPVTGVRRIWQSNGHSFEIDKWLEAVRRVFPHALPKR
jgi:hypothetical protein